MNPVPPNSAVPATTEATHATAPNREYGPRSVPEESDSKENVAGTHWHVRREGTAEGTRLHQIYSGSIIHFSTEGDRSSWMHWLYRLLGPLRRSLNQEA